LSTVAAIVRSHGGLVNVYSEPGAGSTFRVYLPAASAGVEQGDTAVTSGLARGGGELVLVVDDESSVRTITKQTLEAFGYRVLTAADGADAVAVYARSGDEVAVVLTDMTMPIMDGPSTVRALTRRRRAMSGGRSRRRIAERRPPSDVVRVGSARARDVSMVVRTDRRVLDVAPPAGAVHEPDRPTSRCRAPSVI
jgi:CheY-like chemotaxis protein